MRVCRWIEEPLGRCRYVVTPNVDHLVLLRQHAAMREAYAQADLVTADGMPLVLASRLLGRRLPQRVTGADLIPAVFDRAPHRGLKVFLLGAQPGVAARAAGRIEARWPRVRVTGICSPPWGFERDEEENRKILAHIASAAPDLLVVGLGAPKQECWVHRHQAQLAVGVAACVGATIDFLAGTRHRAPRWVQHCGMEWLFRLSQEPRRLAGRYLRDAWTFPRLVWQEVQSQRAAAQGSSRMRMPLNSIGEPSDSRHT